MYKFKMIAAGLIVAGLLTVACGGDDNNGGSTGATGGSGSTGAATGGNANLVIAEADADRVAHAGLPKLEDLAGENWVIVAEDDFTSSGDDFATFIEGNPDCAQLEELSTLQDVFGDEESDTPPLGQAQIEFEQQDPDSLLPASAEVEIEIDEDVAGSRAVFTIVKELFESDDTTNCIISVLNDQFAETGPAGVQLEVTKGTPVAEAPQDGARMAFDIHMTLAGLELDMAMQMYFWPYANAQVQAMFVGTSDSINAELVGGLLETVDENLKSATGE